MRILVCGNKCEHQWPEALVRALTRMGHDVRPVYYRTLCEGDERFVPSQHRGDVPALLQSEEGRRALMELVFYHACDEFRPDVVILAGIYNTWSADALADVRERTGARVVLWAGDNPFAPGAPDIFSKAPYYDAVYFANFRFPDMTSDRFRHTDYLPFGCDPELDRVVDAGAPELEPYRCDVSWLGTLKCSREKFLDVIAGWDVGLQVWGVGFPPDLRVRYPRLAAICHSKRVVGADRALLYSASKIVLNLHHTGFANMKLYEAASCGAFQISNKRLEAQATADALPLAKEVVAYETDDELRELLEYWLRNPDEREAEAQRLRALVHAEHTWDHRLRQLLSDLQPSAIVA